VGQHESLDRAGQRKRQGTARSAERRGLDLVLVHLLTLEKGLGVPVQKKGRGNRKGNATREREVANLDFLFLSIESAPPGQEIHNLASERRREECAQRGEGCWRPYRRGEAERA